MELQNKKQIREYILEIREKSPIKQMQEWNHRILSSLINNEFYKRASVIFTFVSFRAEVDTHKFIEYALKDNKVICVPRIKSKETGIQVFKIESLSDLKTGYFGILEPVDACPEVDSKDIDLILMPGVAFDRYGGRVGYGRGFYDRYLTKMSSEVPKIALAYHFQLLDRVPMDDYDVRIDGIITDEKTVLINKED